MKEEKWFPVMICVMQNFVVVACGNVAALKRSRQRLDLRVFIHLLVPRRGMLSPV